MRSAQYDAARLQNVAMVAGRKRLGDTLLDQEYGDPLIPMDPLDLFENLVRHDRCEPHRRLVQHEQSRQRSESAKGAMATALRQIRERDYAAELRACGAQPIHEIGIVFDGKQVWVAVAAGG